MATYYSSALKATTSNQFAIASNSVSAFLFYPAVSGNNANVEIAYNTSGLGTPSVTASSAINITTTWGDVVKTVVYHNVSTVTVIITSLLNRQSNQVVFTPSSVRAITAVAVTDIGVGGAWTPEDARKRLLGYI